MLRDILKKTAAALNFTYGTNSQNGNFGVDKGLIGFWFAICSLLLVLWGFGRGWP